MKPFVIDSKKPTAGALDFSHLLDPPAGKHGFIQVGGDGHFYEGDSGKRIRFFGTNLGGKGCFPDHELAQTHAHRLATAGANMVRLHYTEAQFKGEDSLIQYSAGHSQSLSPENLDRFDFFVSELKQAGIYIHIDLFVGRSFLPDDGLDYESSLFHQDQIKNIILYNRRLIELQKQHMAALLSHVNPYTGLAYKDEPAVAVVQMCNENSIFYSNNRFPKEHEPYVRELDRRWNKWLLQKYRSREGLDEAWTNEYGVHGLYPGEDPGRGSVERPALGVWMERTTDWYDDYRGSSCPARFADHVEFLCGLQRAYIHEMYGHLRELGVKCPINFSNHPKGMADAWSQMESDVFENNAYWNHPTGAYTPPVRFHRRIMVESDPRNVTAPPFEVNLVSRLSVAATRNKPLLITEWYDLHGTPFYSEAMLMMSAYACLQDWDGLLLFAYSADPGVDLEDDGGLSDFFRLMNDPGSWGQFGVSAAVFRENLVEQARNLIDICYTKNDVQSLPETWITPYGTLPFISRIRNHFLAEDEVYRGGADVALASGFTPTGNYLGAKHAMVYSRSPYKDVCHKRRGRDQWLVHYTDQNAAPLRYDPCWQNDVPAELGRVGSRYAVIRQPLTIDRAYPTFSHMIDQAMKHWGLWERHQGSLLTGRLVSDTDQLTFDYTAGRFTVNAPRILCCSGRVGEDGFRLGRFRFRLRNRMMTVSVFPKDNKDVEASAHLLVQCVGRVENTGVVWEEEQMLDRGHGPTQIDPVRGELLVTGAAAVTAHILDGQGERVGRLQTAACEDGVSVRLDGSIAAISYELLLE